MHTKITASLLVWSITVGLVIGLPAKSHEQSLTAQTSIQAEELNEAQQLTDQVEQLYQQRKYAQVIPLAQRALAIYEKALGPNHLTVATSLNNLALLYQSQGKYDAALPLLQRTLAIREQALGSNHPDVAASLNNLALLYQDQGNYAAALPLLQQALAIWEQALGFNHSLVATGLNNLALLYQDQGNYAAAEPLLQRALDIDEQALRPNYPRFATGLNNLALLYKDQGNYAAAEPLLQRALDIREQALSPNHPDVAASLNNLATLYKDQGNYAAAEPLLQRALDIREQALGPNHPRVATNLNNLALLYKDQGNYAAAEPLLQRALDIREQALGPNHPDAATNLNNLATLYYDQNKYDAALPLLQRALAIREQALGPNHPDVATNLNNLAGLYRAQGKYDAALPLLQRALTIDEQALGPNHARVATNLNNLASLYQNQGNYAAATPLHQRALTILEDALGPNHPNVSASLNNLAWLYQAQGDNMLALNHLQQGLQVEEQGLTLNLTGGSERQKQLYLQTFEGTINTAISLHLQALPREPAAAHLALTAILQRKGRILDLLSSNQQLLRQHLNAPGRKLLDDLAAARRQLAHLTFNRPEQLSPQQYQNQVKQLNSEITTLEDQLSRRSAEFRIQNQPVTVEAIQQLLPANTALVEWVVYQPFNPKGPLDKSWGKARYAAYILQPQGEPQGIDLGDAVTIDQALTELRRSLQDAQTSVEELKQSARRVDALVMQPVRTHLGSIHTLLLSPDSDLNLIPFEALVDETNHYLVETNSFTYLTSGRDLLRLQTPFESKQPPLLLGDPYFERPAAVAQAAENPALPRSIDLTQQSFPPLPGTATEINTILPLLQPRFPGVKSLMENQATKSALEQVQRPQLLHLATHGFFEDPTPPQASSTTTLSENPLLFSGLLLAGFKLKQSKATDNGILTALEVTGMDLLGTKLVVLSACNTGVGQLSTGEGVYGLRRAFVIAGAESQLFSLWRIDDGFTPKLMAGYYQKLLAGNGRSDALRQTQLELLRSQDYSHPYYWASFIASGSWTPLK